MMESFTVSWRIYLDPPSDWRGEHFLECRH